MGSMTASFSASFAPSKPDIPRIAKKREAILDIMTSHDNDNALSQ